MPDPSQPPALTARELKRQRIERQLDEALAQTFPASDPVSIVTSQHEEWEDEEEETPKP